MYGLSVFSNVFIDFHYVFTETKTSKTKCSSSLESLFIFTFSNSNIFLYYTTSISRFLYDFILLPCETNWLLATSRLESLYLLWIAYLGLGMQYVSCSSGSLQSSIWVIVTTKLGQLSLVITDFQSEKLYLDNQKFGLIVRPHSPKFTDCTTVQPLSTVVYRIISWQTICICIFFFSRLDVVGGNDGSIRMFEYIHPDQIALFRPPGQTERINKIAFNPMGNKVSEYADYCFVVQGVCDISQKIQEKEWVFLEKTYTVRHQLALKGICVMTLHSPSWWFKLRDLRL